VTKAIVEDVMRMWIDDAVTLNELRKQIFDRAETNLLLRNFAKATKAVVRSLDALNDRAKDEIASAYQNPSNVVPVALDLGFRKAVGEPLSIGHSALGDMRSFCIYMGSAVSIAIDDSHQPKPGRPSNEFIVQMALSDLAEIYEALSGKAPTRRVRSAKNANPGKEYGPFVDFVRIAWKMAGGNEKSILAGLKNWSKRRKIKGKSNFWISTRLGLHPEWKLLLINE
jgi:hypothetical protein